MTRHKHHYSFREAIAYVTGWALIYSCLTVAHDDNVITFVALIGLLILPGAMVCGTIGFVFGGRPLFRPAALCGTSVWVLLNMIPVIRLFH